jgi:hypothetical protein
MDPRRYAEPPHTSADKRLGVLPEISGESKECSHNIRQTPSSQTLLDFFPIIPVTYIAVTSQAPKL